MSIATSVARRRPAPPIIRIYIQDIGKIDAEPNGADDTGPNESFELYSEYFSNKGWFGRNGARCFLLEQSFSFEIKWIISNRTYTPIGPMPGPPPPWGMQNVLCRFKCDTSEP